MLLLLLADTHNCRNTQVIWAVMNEIATLHEVCRAHSSLHTPPHVSNLSMCAGPHHAVWRGAESACHVIPAG